MSDWVIDNDDASNNIQNMNSADWEIAPEENESPTDGENSYWGSLKSAPGKILSDVGGAIVKGVGALPNYFQKAKTEVPGFLNLFGQMQRHPLHALGQGFAGVNEAINSMAQFPLNVAKYGSNRLNLLPQGVTNAIQKITPDDTTQAINQLFGQPQYPGEALMRGAVRNAPSLYGVGEISSVMKPSSLFTTKNSIKNTILNQHDALENRATEAFKKVSDEVNNRGINKISLAPESEVNSLVSNVFPMIKDNQLDRLLYNARSDWLDDMRQYFPDTRASKKLINNAKTGDYNAFRKLQTDLYQNAKKNLGSSLEADRMRGSEMLEKRNDINEMISNHLRNTGNHDLDELLNQARGDWSTLQKTYYNDNMNNALVKMVDKQFRKVPNNLVNILSEDSIPMQNLRDFHPGLAEKLSGYKKGQNVLGKLSKYGIPAVVGAGTGMLGYEYGKNR